MSHMFSTHTLTGDTGASAMWQPSSVMHDLSHPGWTNPNHTSHRLTRFNTLLLSHDHHVIFSFSPSIIKLPHMQVCFRSSVPPTLPCLDYHFVSNWYPQNTQPIAMLTRVHSWNTYPTRLFVRCQIDSACIFAYWNMSCIADCKLPCVILKGVEPRN